VIGYHSLSTALTHAPTSTDTHEQAGLGSSKYICLNLSLCLLCVICYVYECNMSIFVSVLYACVSVSICVCVSVERVSVCLPGCVCMYVCVRVCACCVCSLNASVPLCVLCAMHCAEEAPSTGDWIGDNDGHMKHDEL
jgi:hypothetical protein